MPGIYALTVSTTDSVSSHAVRRDEDRDRDRAALPAPMRRDVRLLGDILGEVICDSDPRTGPDCWPTWNGSGARDRCAPAERDAWNAALTCRASL